MASFTVSNADQLAAAINTANTNGDPSNTITLTQDIDLTALMPDSTGSKALPVLGLTGSPKTLIIDGGGHTIDGGNQTRIFFANTGDITIENVTLADGLAEGGPGADAFVFATAPGKHPDRITETRRRPDRALPVDEHQCFFDTLLNELVMSG